MPKQEKKRPAPDKRRRPAKKQKQKRVHRHLVSEFKPDSQRVSFFKTMRLTQLQRQRILRWVLYIAVCVLCLVVQDSIMSRVRFFGATSDLAVSAMLIITVLEGSEIGSIFILLASCIFYFSGSAAGPYSVGMLTVFGILASVFRQMMLHRSSGSIIGCAGLAAMAYEVGLYFVGLFLGIARWTRLPAFFLTGILTVLAMIPLYHILYRIGQIGGITWKE